MKGMHRECKYKKDAKSMLSIPRAMIKQPKVSMLKQKKGKRDTRSSTKLTKN